MIVSVYVLLGFLNKPTDCHPFTNETSKPLECFYVSKQCNECHLILIDNKVLHSIRKFQEERIIKVNICYELYVIVNQDFD